ncbi:unnamed protein product [Symbiodinium necroappetens]|uniref:Uncharacterized protein n=1 Tax=Symbiodinium necroappetens TaxID=1628268 RepID=A0A812PXZ4_9DINO|nr:unnamed protein product [Symbiodinium necroappetens]
MAMLQGRAALGFLAIAPSPLQCREAVSLLCTCRGVNDDALKLSALWRWYCMSAVRCDAVDASPGNLQLWKQLAILLQGVSQARHVSTSMPCRWVLDGPADLSCAVKALQDARLVTHACLPYELFLATISGGGGADHLQRLRTRWDTEGHRSNSATCFVGEGFADIGSFKKAGSCLHTREGRIDVQLLFEMQRFKGEESRGVCLAAWPLSEQIGCCWDGTETTPPLLCVSATDGIDLFSTDVFRFEGKPGASRRGTVAYSVDELDLRRELERDQNGGAPDEGAGSVTAHAPLLEGSVNDEFVVEPHAASLDEITSEASERDYAKDVLTMANAFRRFDAGLPVNLLFALYGESRTLLSPRSLGGVEGSESELFDDDSVTSGPLMMGAA